MTIDTKELRRLAQAAMHPVTKGRWMRLFGERTVYDRMEDGCRGIPVVSTPFSPPHPFDAACLDFIAAANPAAVIELLDRLEAAEKERDVLKAKIERMEKQEPTHWSCNVLQADASWKEEVGREIPPDGYYPIRDIKPLYALPGAKGEEK